MTGFVKGERDGNVIRPKGSNNSGSTYDEFSSHEDIEQSELDSDDLVVEQLSDGRTKLREREEGEHVIKINPDSEYARKMLSDDEIEELSQKHEVVNGKPTESPDINSVWDGMRKDVEAHNREVAKRKKEKEIEKAKEFTKPERHRKELSELSGGEFAQLVKDGQSDSQQHNEELENAIEAIEQKYDPIINGDEPEIPETEELSDGIDAFREYDNPVFKELADDLEKSSSETMYESVDENTKRVTTSEPEMKNALRNHESEPFDGSVELEQDTGNTVVAVVSKEE